MGNKTVGKKFDRQSSKAVISAIDMKQFANYMHVEGELLPISNRISFRETIEEWGYLWAHRLLEDAYIRPNFDIKSILKAITADEPSELNLSIRSDFEEEDQDNLEVNTQAKIAKLEELQNKFHVQKKEKNSNIGKNSLATMFMITRKALWHVHIIGLAITAVEVVLEGEKHDKMISTMDMKVKSAKKELNDKIFELRLTDLKSKFLALKSTFDIVVNGNDDIELRKSRLDSIFVICEEIFIMISDPMSEFYKSSHCCIDLIAWFMVMHLGMLSLAVESFNLKDYWDRLDYCSEFYPILIKSYIEQAISNYVKPIILNYHNHYSSVKEIEEIYYELTDSVIYTINNNERHTCWKTDKETMAQDNMYYNFKEDKLHWIKPAFFIGPVAPLLCRALRYGVILKLEDLFTPYESSIDLIVHKIRKNPLKEMKFNNLFDNESDKENEHFEEIKHLSNEELKDSDSFESLSPIKVSPSKNISKGISLNIAYNSYERSDITLVGTDNYHFKRSKRCEENRQNVLKVKKNAK